jgi:hypothetical protein
LLQNSSAPFGSFWVVAVALSWLQRSLLNEHEKLVGNLV